MVEKAVLWHVTQPEIHRPVEQRGTSRLLIKLSEDGRKKVALPAEWIPRNPWQNLRIYMLMKKCTNCLMCFIKDQTTDWKEHFFLKAAIKLTEVGG